MKYVRCESCKNIMRLLDGEWECIICGNDLCGSDRVTERDYREHWKGIVGQPFRFDSLKSSTQTTFIKEKGGKKC